MGNAKMFAAQLTAFIEKDVKKYTEEKYKKICDDLGRSVIRDTPVLTGRAKSNWHFTFSGPSRQYDKNARGTSGSASYARLRAAIGGLTLKRSFYITNNAPYINRLEDGSSLKAPSGMLGKNLARVRGKYKIL